MPKKTVEPTPVLLDLPRIMLQIDRNKVSEQILAIEEGDKPLVEWDYDDCQRLVYIAAEKWLPRDLAEFTMDGVEIKFEEGREEWPRRLKGFIDVAGTVKGNIEPFKQFAGKKYIIDWKTSKNTLGTDWRNRLVDSNQWMLYSEIYKASVFLYRGLSRNGTTAEVIIQVPQSNESEVIQLVKMVGKQVDVIKDELVWPRNKPFACNAFGRECPYYTECMDYSMPRGLLPEDKALSHSFINTFQLCNERARREATAEQVGGSDETAFGKAVHRGLAELWKQAYEVFGDK